MNAECGLLNSGVVRFDSDRPFVRDEIDSSYQRVAYVDKNGDIRERDELRPVPKNPIAGLVYDPATMSLTAMLNNGIHLEQVSLDMMPNDPNDIAALATARFERAYNRELKSVQAGLESEVTTEPPKVDESSQEQPRYKASLTK